MSRHHPCEIYLVARDDHGRALRPVKCGISRNADSRMKSLQTASAQKLGLMAFFTLGSRDFAAAAEARVHRCLAAQRLLGEWFDVSPREALETLCLVIAEIIVETSPDEETAAQAIRSIRGLSAAYHHAMSLKREDPSSDAVH